MASTRIQDWWREANRPLTRRQLLELAVLAAICTVCAACFFLPVEHRPRSSLEPVAGNVVDKQRVRRRRRGILSYVSVVTERGRRKICMNAEYRSAWNDIQVGDRLECLVEYDVAMALAVNGKQLFTYEDYCTKRDREGRFWGIIQAVIAALAWFGSLGGFLCRWLCPEEATAGGEPEI